uniref:NADP-retinol dehydrogenase n=1 Tax=Callorhinchus milii TaxID=7868 RepID=A0A4W3HF68_CALMI
MIQKTVLIAGCSSGIGLALAIKLAKDNEKRFMVYATMRNLDKRRDLVEASGNTLGKTLDIKQLDVYREQSIQDCVNISNAGMGMIGSIECQTLEEMKAVVDTNFFGLVRLLKEIFPDMKKRKRGQIVVISSVLGIQGILFNDIYAASKFAVEGFCEGLAIQVLKFKLKISLIEPDPVVTGFEKKVFAGGSKIDLSAADKETADMFTNIYFRNYKEIFSSLGQSANEVAESCMFSTVLILKLSENHRAMVVEARLNAKRKHVTQNKMKPENVLFRNDEEHERKNRRFGLDFK